MSPVPIIDASYSSTNGFEIGPIQIPYFSLFFLEFLRLRSVQADRHRAILFQFEDRQFEDRVNYYDRMNFYSSSQLVLNSKKCMLNLWPSMMTPHLHPIPNVIMIRIG